jgi:hypothetical protein
MFLLGSPAEERALRLDDRRIEDLSAIARAVDLYWTRHTRLPSSLDELQQEPGVNVTVLDPGAAQRYEYRPAGAETYELCAQFARDSRQSGPRAADGFWSHGAGHQCFRREAKRVR